MKLELKHLAPYLPYGLEINNKALEHNQTLNGIEQANEGTYLHAYGKNNYQVESQAKYYYSSDLNVKPILRSLSDLTKQRIDWIYFGVIATDNDMYGTREEFGDDLDIWLCDMSHLPMCIYSFLIRNHFDVFGLIPAGLAIDINTL